MGQRSQIYIRINDEKGNKHLIARYYQWNFGTRMISRARSIIDYLQRHECYPGALIDYNREHLHRYMDINFDYKDIVIGHNILMEYNNGLYENFIDVFNWQDNNDGQLYIDMIIDYSKKRKNGNYKTTYKYAFREYCNGNKPLTPIEYMEWDSQADTWQNCYPDEVKYTESNMRYIEKHAELMTPEELQEYINYDYEGIEAIPKF